MNWDAFGVGLRNALNTPLFFISGAPVTAMTLLTALAVLVGAFWLSRLAQRGLARGLGRRGFRDPGTLATVQRLVHYTVVAVGIGVALETVGINLTTLFAAGAVFAVAIGFATQNILQNFVSGVILLVERSITPSDVLEVDGVMVRVEEMRTRATVARTMDDEQIIIPNSILVQASVKNFTLKDSLLRIRCRVGVSYASDVTVAGETLYRAAASVEGRAQEKKPVVMLHEFGDSSVVFEISIWTSDPWTFRTTRSHLNHAIWHGLKEAGITIAFPQMDVHFDPPFTTAAGALASSRQ